MASRTPSVLMLVDRWIPGGLVKHASDLCSGLATRGQECAIASWLPPGAQKPDRVEFFHLPLYKENGSKSVTGFFRAVRALKTLLASRGFEIVHIHSRYMTLVAAFAGCGKRAGLVYTSHSIFENLRWLPWYPRNIICLTEAGKSDFLRNRFLASDLKLKVIPNGVAVEGLSSGSSEASRPASFVFLGRLEKSKGVALIIRAVAEVQDTDVTAVLVGSGSLERELKSLAASLGVQDRIEFTGWLQDTTGVLDRACALILPATSMEGFGYVVLEAFARHRAVIASDLPVFDETVREGFSGFRFRRNDHSALAGAMRRAIDQPELVREMGENGFRLLCDEFGLDRMVDRTMECYEEVLGSQSR